MTKQSRKQTGLLWVLCTLAMTLSLAGCAQQLPHINTLSDLRESPYCVMLVIDALGPDPLQNLVDQGDIPNIQKHILDRAMQVDNMISVFPSVTAAAVTSMLTGVFPGRHQIPNFSWANRDNGEYRSYIGTDIQHFENDLHEHARTIFHYLPKEESASFGFIQGSQAGKDDSMMFTTLNPFHEMAPLTHLFLSDLFSKVGLSKGVPHFLTYYEWGLDVEGHRKGPYSPAARDVVRNMDKQFGKIVEAYKQRGLYDKTYFILASDHGLAEVKETIYLDQAFHNAGFRRKLISYNLGEGYFPRSWARADSIWFSQEKIYRYNAIIGSAGGGAAAIDLVRNGGRNKNGELDQGLWKEQPVYEELLRYDLGDGALVKQRFVNVISFVRDMAPVDFFIVRENRPGEGESQKVLVVSKEGMSRVIRRPTKPNGFEYAYELVEGEDPLRYVTDSTVGSLARSGFHDGDTWLEATAEHAYPDGPVLLSSISDTPRSGTLLVSMRPGWGVNSQIVAKHAGYERDEMRAIFAVSGPGLSKGRIPVARIVDITPTILALLGDAPRPQDFDGRPIPEILKKAKK